MLKTYTEYCVTGNMWLASPSSRAQFILRVDNNGQVDCDGYPGKSEGFRPIVRLKSSVQLERDGENKDYKEIVNLMSKMAR